MNADIGGIIDVECWYARQGGRHDIIENKPARINIGFGIISMRISIIAVCGSQANICSK